MWVFEEEVTLPSKSKHYDANSELCTKPQKLTTLINKFHENVKYLPDIPLPTNIVANPSIEDAVKDSTILVFNLPHQFIDKTCNMLEGKIVPYARAISCIKGVDVGHKGIKLLSEHIGERLGIYCGALSGANIATEVALEKWCETTVAYDPPPVDSTHPTPAGSPQGSRPGTPSTPNKPSITMTPVDGVNGNGKRPLSSRLQPLPNEYPPLNHENMKKLFHRPYFHVALTTDVAGVSLGGALKNIVALAAGFVDGLGWGDNAKSAVMRRGALEEIKFGKMFFGDSFQDDTIKAESCGIADIITSCSGGRNERCAKLSVQRGVSINEIEKTELNGQMLQGTSTAYDVHSFLKTVGKEKEFPLFTAVYGELLQLPLRLER